MPAHLLAMPRIGRRTPFTRNVAVTCAHPQCRLDRECDEYNGRGKGTQHRVRCRYRGATGVPTPAAPERLNWTAWTIGGSMEAGMRQLVQTLSLVVLAFVAVSCGNTNPVGPSEVRSTDALISALQQQGATVVRGEPSAA